MELKGSEDSPHEQFQVHSTVSMTLYEMVKIIKNKITLEFYTNVSLKFPKFRSELESWNYKFQKTVFRLNFSSNYQL